MNIGFASDHRGYKLKIELIKYFSDNGYNIVDYGNNDEESCDYVDYAYKLGNGILSNEIDFGVAICGSGIGMSIALNKMKGIYCAKVSTKSEAALSKAHNDANAIAISEEMERDLMKEVINTFIETPFTNIDRYKIRNEKIKEIEANV